MIYLFEKTKIFLSVETPAQWTTSNAVHPWLRNLLRVAKGNYVRSRGKGGGWQQGDLEMGGIGGMVEENRVEVIEMG